MRQALQRGAMACLLAALAVPALLIFTRTAHPFSTPELVALPLLALLAAGLAWAAQGHRLSRPWLLWLGALTLAWMGLAGVTAQANPAALALWPWLQRATLLGTGLLLAWEAGRRRESGPPEPLRRLGLGLVALWCLAAAGSFRPDLGLRETLQWGSYALLFCAAWILGAQAEPRRIIVLLLFGVGALNAAYGLVQTAGWDPMVWQNNFGGRALGFLGNPNYLGGHLALLLPLAIALALDGRGRPSVRPWRWLLAAGLALGLLLTQTRGAWAGAVVGLGLLFWGVARMAPGLLQRQRRPLLIFAGAMLLALGALVVVQPQLRSRLNNLAQGEDAEAGRRAFLFKRTAQLALEHPFLGVGPGNYRIWFPSVQTRGVAPQDLRSQPYVRSEHAHNDLLQMAADAGWAAALLWAALLGALFLTLGRGLGAAAVARQQPEGLLVLGVLGGLAALSVHGLANFPFLMQATQASAWVLAALALRALQAPAPVSAPPPLSRPLLALLLAGALGLFWQGARDLRKERHWYVGAGEVGLGRLDEAAQPLQRALSLDPSEDRLWRLQGQAELQRGQVWNGIASLREALRLNPYDAETALNLGRALLQIQAPAEAETVLARVAKYAPNFAGLWEPLAAALFQQGKFAEAVKAYDWMLYFRVNDEAAFANKAAAQGNLGHLPQALITLKQAEQQLPNNGKIQVNLAITYLKLGLRAEAKAAWVKANALSPSDPQVKQLRGVLH